MPQHEPATPDELEARYTEIEDLIASGYQTAHIIKHAREKTSWGVSDRQVRNYVDEVHRRMKTGARKIDRAYEAFKTSKQLTYIIEYNLREGNHKIALQALALKIKLHRLDDPAYEPNWDDLAAKAGTSREKLIALGAEIFEKMGDERIILN